MSQSSKIKLVIAINDFLVGGAQRLIANQINYFDYSEFDIVLVILKKVGRSNSLIEAIPDYVNIVEFDFSRFWRVDQWCKLMIFMYKLKPHAVVSHLFFSNTVFRVLKIFLNYSVITVEHNTYIYKRWFEIWLDKVLARFNYKIIAVSSTVRDFALRQAGLPEWKMEVIHNGIDVNLIRKYQKTNKSSEVIDSLGLDGKRVVLNVARLAKQKNHSLLIRSFALFAKNHSNYVLLILGEGELKNELQDLINSLDMTDQVLLLGHRSNIFDYYMISEFLVSSSLVEGLSLAYLEALAFGLPLVVTKTAGTDELVREGYNGLFVDWDESSLCGAMDYIANSNIKDLKFQASKSAEKFDIKKNVLAYSNLIKESVKNP